MGVNLKPSSCAPRSHKTGRSKGKPLDPSDDETSSGLKSDDVPKSCLIEEEIQRVIREEPKLVKYDLKKVKKEQKLLKSHLADLVWSCICNTLKEEVVPAICSLLEDTSRRAVKEELKHASSQSAQRVRWDDWGLKHCFLLDKLKGFNIERI